MNIFNYLFPSSKETEPVDLANLDSATADTVLMETKSFVDGNTRVMSGSTIVNSYTFDGEKTPGELGAPIHLIPDYNALRLRAHEANLTNDVVRIITGKFFKWVIGTGLKLQAEPVEEVLKLEGITANYKDFRDNVESYFYLYGNSAMSDHAKMTDLHANAKRAYETAFLGGDALVVLRLDKDLNVTVQVIDGQHIATPFLDAAAIKKATDAGNTIHHGIELNKQGQQVAYYVAKDGNTILTEYERIEAVSKKTGCTMAWMVYGSKHRIDHHRGVSRLAAVLEKVQKLDRYTEASVSAAEERAKIPFTIEHSRFSDGENPFLEKIKLNTGAASTVSSFEQGAALAPNIARTTNKQVWNMPIDSKLKAMESQSETNYDAFFQAIFVQLCAGMDIPPEVALQKYNSNYSASRAAINGWEFIIKIYRDEFIKSFYSPIYKLWLYVHVLKDKVSAPGYLNAINTKNQYVIEAFGNTRFTGANMPHIDPKKEVDALRKMLGDKTLGELPLITAEQATERLGNGDFYENVKKTKEENNSITIINPEENAIISKTEK